MATVLEVSHRLSLTPRETRRTRSRSATSTTTVILMLWPFPAAANPISTSLSVMDTAGSHPWGRSTAAESVPAGIPGVPLVFSNNFAFHDIDLQDSHVVSWSLNPASNVGSLLGTFGAGLLNDSTGMGNGLVHWQYEVAPELVNALPIGSTRSELID